MELPDNRQGISQIFLLLRLTWRRPYSEIHNSQFKIMITRPTILNLTAQALFALSLVSWPHSLYAQAGAVEKPVNNEVPQEKILEDIVSTNARVRLDAAIELDNQRAQMIRKLLAIINSTNSVNVKIDAVVVIGEYRVSEAAPILVRHFEWDWFSEFTPIKPIMTKEDWAERNPVMIALVKIGMPAIPALLDKITQTDDARITFDCVTICNAIEGTEVTQFRLQGLLDKSADSKEKERIQSALDMLKDMKIPEN